MTTIPRSEIQTLDPGNLVSLFELDATGIGGELSLWAPWVNRLGQSIVFQGRTYTPFQIDASGFERTVEGSLPRPHLKASNLNGQVGLLCRQYGDLVGAVVTRRLTLEKFLDPVNFPGGVNPTAGAYEYPPETWVIEQRVSEVLEEIEWELVAACDATGLQVPSRPMAENCPWTKANDPKAGNCPYAENCLKTIPACKSHFGATAELPYGGWDGLIRIRQ